jgi:hypothetical protein
MISKGTMKTVAYMIADSLYKNRCMLLDKYILECFDKAFEGEHISQERRERIKDKFYKTMLGSEENASS